jgi:hypothetical protein
MRNSWLRMKPAWNEKNQEMEKVKSWHQHPAPSYSWSLHLSVCLSEHYKFLNPFPSLQLKEPWLSLAEGFSENIWAVGAGVGVWEQEPWGGRKLTAFGCLSLRSSANGHTSVKNMLCPFRNGINHTQRPVFPWMSALVGAKLMYCWWDINNGAEWFAIQSWSTKVYCWHSNEVFMVQTRCLHSGNVDLLSQKSSFLYFSYFPLPFVSIFLNMYMKYYS